MRGVNDFDGLPSYRRFIDEIVSRKNARSTKRIAAERPALQPLPGQRTCDHEETIVTVTSSGGFMLKKVFYTVPSRLMATVCGCGCMMTVSICSSAAHP